MDSKKPCGKRWTVHYLQNKPTKKELHDELKRIVDKIVPFKYSSILVNNSTVCVRHKDKSNVGKSFLVSIGDYDGCKLMIENKSYSARYQPLIFDGAKVEHWNTNDLKGNKYSIVYYYIEKHQQSGSKRFRLTNLAKIQKF